MKKYFYLAILTIVLVACSQSQEKKAEVMIRESLKTTLFKPETYRPVETKVDSAYSPYDDPELYKEMIKLIELSNEIDELKEKAKDAKSKMAMWDSPYSTAYGKNEYREAKEEYEETNAKMEKLREKGLSQYMLTSAMLKADRKFVGFKAMHNYRADNNAGNTLIGNTVFFIDKNFEKIMYSLDVDEYDKMQEVIKQLEEELEENE